MSNSAILAGYPTNPDLFRVLLPGSPWSGVIDALRAPSRSARAPADDIVVGLATPDFGPPLLNLNQQLPGHPHAESVVAQALRNTLLVLLAAVLIQT